MSNTDIEPESDDVTSQDVTPQISEPEDSLQTKQHKSIIHKYFTLNKTHDRYNCNHCNKNYKIARDGSTSSLWKHFKCRHNDLYLEINQLADALNQLEISEPLVIYVLVVYYIIIYNNY